MSAAAATTTQLTVAYLVNQYPKVSHSFIRREILALERRGIEVVRFGVRGWDAETPDPADAIEKSRTRHLMAGGLARLAVPVLRTLLQRPGRFLSALAAAWSLGRAADRPMSYHLVYLAQACLLLAWLKNSRASHLHAHFGTNAAEVALLTRVLGGPPFSFTVHGPEEFDRPGALHLGDKMRRAAFVVAISSYGRSQLFRWASHDVWPRIEVVHCGLDAAFAAGGDDRPAEPTRLVCVGRLSEQKGQLLLLQALRRLVQDGIEIELVLAGDGELRPDIDAAIDALGLRAHARITGWIGGDTVRDEILSARALVLPSFAEGLPVVLMEAMALGRPVITTWIAGIPELVTDGSTGWLVAAGDVDALVAAMKACLAAPAPLLEAMGRAARSVVRERHDVDREAGKLAVLFAHSSAAAP